MHVSHQLISAEGPDRGSISFIRERGGGRGKEGEKREKGGRGREEGGRAV